MTSNLDNTLLQQELNQWVYLIESAGINLETKKKGDNPNDYVLEGIAAVFGEENNNHRIYEEKEYLPHLEYLNKKIGENRLLGELDHPEKFDVSLKHISHIVEKLEYIKESRQLKIRVRLLDTPHGRIAKTLVDAGVPISISSRAAGSVMENKKVRIKKIFTYDLVADPGFEKAQLERIYESANFSSTSDTSVFSNLTDISESFGVENSGKLKIYNVDPQDAAFKKALMDDKKNSTADMNQYVTVEELNDYSAVIKKDLDSIKEKLKGSEGAPTNEAEDLVARIERLERYTKYLAENVDKNIQYTEYVAENLDKNIEYSKYIAENVDRNISYSEYLAENLDKGIDFANYLAENLEKNISYSEYLAENLDKSISYGEYLAENLDKSISYGEYLAENLDRSISYGEYLAENVDRAISYGEYLAENIEKNIAYSEYLAEKVENNIAYSEYIAENVLTTATPEATPVTEPEQTPAAQTEATPVADATPAATEETTPAPVNEEQPIAPVTESERYVGLSDKITQLLESAKVQKAGSKMNESKHHFFRFLSEDKRNEFEALDEAKKEKVVTALKNGAYFSEADVVTKWDAALVENENTEPKFLQMIPEPIKPLYESLTEREKEAVIAQSKFFKLDTEYQIKNFWTTRGFVRGKVVGLVKLNENESAVAPSEKPKTYNSEYMDKLAKSLERRFK